MKISKNIAKAAYSWERYSIIIIVISALYLICIPLLLSLCFLTKALALTTAFVAAICVLLTIVSGCIIDYYTCNTIIDNIKARGKKTISLTGCSNATTIKVDINQKQ